jgi:hypothetical protein
VIQGTHAMTDWSRPVQVASVQTLQRHIGAAGQLLERSLVDRMVGYLALDEGVIWMRVS